MRAPRAGLLAGVCVGVTGAAEAGAVTLSWGLKPPYTSVLFGVYNVTIVVIGALIAVRHPRSPIGWILAGFTAVTAVLSDFVAAYGHRASLDHWPGGPLAEWLGFGFWSPAALMWVLALLFVPTGRLPGPRWRLVAWVGCAWATRCTSRPGCSTRPTVSEFRVGREPVRRAGTAVRRADRGGRRPADRGRGRLAGLAGRAVQGRRAGRAAAAQVGGAGRLDIVVLLAVCVPFYLRSAAVQALTPVALTAAALCLGASVLRYRLFDVDRIVNRTVVYLTLSVLLAAAYGGTAIALGAILGGFSSWTAAAGTLVAAAAFRPLRRAVQDTVDRRFYREKHSAGVRIDGFLEGLRAEPSSPSGSRACSGRSCGTRRCGCSCCCRPRGHYCDVRGNPADADPARPAVRLDRGGTADVLVEYAPADDPARDAAVRGAVERSRLAIEIARLGVELNRQLDELDRSRARIAGCRRRGAAADPARPARRRAAAAGHGGHLAASGRGAAAGRRPDGRPTVSTWRWPISARPSRSCGT